MKIFTSILLAGCLTSPVVMADSCRHERDFSFEVPAASLTRLNIDVGAGRLYIRGEPGSGNVSVRARACADSRNQLDEMDLRHSLRGETLNISSGINSSRMPFTLFGSRYAYIDVDINMPAGLIVDIEDGSGDITIEDASGNFSIDDGSGDITVRRVIGDVSIDDGSGDIRLEDITGSVRIADGSGDITLNRISANVHILEDGSGSIRVQTVGGNVIIDDDGSGDIKVYDVTGDFVARDTGSGDVDYRGIGGRTDVRN